METYGNDLSPSANEGVAREALPAVTWGGPWRALRHLWHARIPKSHWMLTLASIAVVIAALYLAKGLLVPLTLAVLLSFLLSRCVTGWSGGGWAVSRRCW